MTPIRIGSMFSGYGGLKAIGNGVCPQQASAALRQLLGMRVAA